MFATGVTVGLAKEIIDDSCFVIFQPVFYYPDNISVNKSLLF